MPFDSSSLSAEVQKLLPFHFVIDTTGRIIYESAALNNALPFSIIEQSILSAFSLSNFTELFEKVTSKTNPLSMELTFKESGLKISGQWISAAEKHLAFYSNKAPTSERQKVDRNELSILETLYEKSGIGVVIAKENGEVIYVNEIALDHMGTHSGEISEKKIFEFDPNITSEKDWTSLVSRIREFDHLRVSIPYFGRMDAIDKIDLNRHSIVLENELYIVTRSERQGNASTLKFSKTHDLRLQDILINLASVYADINASHLNQTIHQSLQQLGSYLKSDRAYLFSYNFENDTCTNTHEWCNEGITPEIDNLQEVPLRYIPHWVKEHKHGRAFYVPDILAVKETDPGLYAILSTQNIKSLISVPIFKNRTLIGFVGLDSVRQYYQYSLKEQELLSVFGHLLSNVQTRLEWEQANN